MEAVDIQVANFFAREDLEFVKCPLCTLPLLRTSCDEYRKSRGRYEFDAILSECEQCDQWKRPVEMENPTGWHGQAHAKMGTTKAANDSAKANPRPLGN